MLKVSNVTVLKWIRKYSQQVEEIKSERVIEVVELDELHTYIGNKKTIVGYGLLLIDIESGSSLLSVDPRGLKPVRS